MEYAASTFEAIKYDAVYSGYVASLQGRCPLGCTEGEELEP